MSVGTLTRYGLPFSNVAPNATATNNVTPGRTLQTFRMRLGGTFTKAQIALVRMKANGKIIAEASGADLDLMNAYRGIAQNAAFLDLPFTDLSLNNELDRQVGAFDTSLGIANITTEVSIGGATSPTMVPILVEAAAQKDQGGAMARYAPILAKLLRYPFNIATGGRLPVTFPFGPQSGAIIKRVHVFSSAMTGATVKQDGLVIHESTDAENRWYLTANRMAPQANVYTIDFCADGDISKALDTRDARSLEWLFDFSGAASGNIYVEYLDVLGNL